MARPRTPAKILELRGAFKANPGRKREDAPGSAPFETDPPASLPQNAVQAWREIVVRLPRIALSSADEHAVEAAAMALSGLRNLGDLGALHPNFGKLSAELRAWLIQLGMTPQARTKIPPADDKTKGGGNPFASV